MPDDMAPTGGPGLPDSTAPTGGPGLPDDTAPTGGPGLPDDTAPTGGPGLPDDTAPTRARPVWRLLRAALATAGTAGSDTVRVLDCGGGTGSFAVPLARAGAHVTVVDASADALATLRRRAADAAVADRVAAVQGDIESLGELGESVPDAAFDLVLLHGVLEAVADGGGAGAATAALRAVLAAVRPGGVVSVLVANPDAAVLARALAGELEAALAELDARVAGRYGPDSLLGDCAALGLDVQSVSGVGIFSELVPGADADAGGDLLDRLEDLAATRSPYREIAGRVHVLARRPEL